MMAFLYYGIANRLLRDENRGKRNPDSPCSCGMPHKNRHKRQILWDCRVVPTTSELLAKTVGRTGFRIGVRNGWENDTPPGDTFVSILPMSNILGIP